MNTRSVNFDSRKKNTLLCLTLLTVLTVTGSHSFAESSNGDMVVTGPGFKVEKKQGWFGSKETQYSDALGNSYKKKKGWFGREKKEGSFFGSKVSQNGNDISVTAPNGTKLIEQKRGIFGNKRTEIHTERLFDVFKAP